MIENYAAVLPGIDPGLFSLIFIEYRGIGLSKGIPGVYTLDEIVSDAEEVVQSLGWERFHVLGHSFGGFVAQWLAADWGQRIKSVVAVGPVPANGNPMDEAGKALLADAMDNDDSALRVFEAYAGGRLPMAWARSMLRYTRELCDPVALRSYQCSAIAQDFSARMWGLQTPFLALLGAHDSLFNQALMEQTLGQWLPNLSIEIIPSSGHVPMLETPLLFAAAIERFLCTRPPLNNLQ